MSPDGYPVRRFPGRCLSSWAWSSLLGAVAACSPAGGSGVADPPVSVTPVATDPPSGVVDPVTPPAGGGDSAAAAGEFIDPDEMPMIASVPVRRRGLLQKQVTCPDGASTSVSGTVYIPSGELPLYNAMVYVPDADLRPFTAGSSCGCEISGEPIASALTDSTGRFVLKNVPVGADIPIVVQVGEWRREFKVDQVEPCADTAIADQTLRLPSKQSEGDIPKIAVATGGSDALECLVRKLGVAAEEFTHPNRDGRVNLFAGYSGAERFANSMNGGEPFPPSGALWADAASLQAYDIVLLSCDGRRPDQDGAQDKDARAMQGMFDYLNTGGRVFASHYQEVWFQKGPAPFPDLAEYTPTPDHLDELTAQLVTDFPKGQAMSQWALSNGSSTIAGQVEIRGAQRTIERENPDYAQRWLASEDPATVQYVSANTPLGASDGAECGRLVLSDIHVSAGGLPEGDDPGDDFSAVRTGFPDGCVTTTLSAQEKLLAFMLFDISACIVPDSQEPTAPPIIR
jgi:hypothetical protein